MRYIWLSIWFAVAIIGLVFGVAQWGRQVQGAERGISLAAGTGAAAVEAETRERLYFATGEYDCQRDWDAIIRLDDVSVAGSEGITFTENLTIPVKSLMTGTSGLSLNFVHNIYVDEARDEMYMATLFTGVEEGTVCDPEHMDHDTGSIAVLSNVSRPAGEQQLVRHIHGNQTELVQPHGIWLDHRNERLYVANTHGGNILVFEDAYTIDGNVPPSYTISSPAMKAPTHIFIDEESDQMFVTSFNGVDLQLDETTVYTDDTDLPVVLIFENASDLKGEVEPSIRIMDNDGALPDPTRLRQGVAHITHNVWYASEHNLIFVVHHTNEVLVYDLDRIDEAPPGCANRTRCALTPKAIIEVGRDTLTRFFSAYGLFYLPEEDRLYVTVGRTDADPASPYGFTIAPGVPPNVILAYDDVSTYESLVPTAFTPSRRIYWSTGVNDYYPPQPLWVTVDHPTFLPITTR